ncbi:MAG: DUF2017 family protein [Acidimicrobiales bacterium]
MVAELAGDLEADPSADDLRRLRPPAYADDPERDLEYQLLAGEELRQSQRAAIEASAQLLDRTEVGDEDLWALVRTLNAVRLAVGTRLGIEDDDHRRPRFGFRRSPDEQRNWAIYELATQVQHEATLALQDGLG